MMILLFKYSADERDRDREIDGREKRERVKMRLI